VRLAVEQSNALSFKPSSLSQMSLQGYTQMSL
jgi:hypothetical protein